MASITKYSGYSGGDTFANQARKCKCRQGGTLRKDNSLPITVVQKIVKIERTFVVQIIMLYYVTHLLLKKDKSTFRPEDLRCTYLPLRKPLLGRCCRWVLGFVGLPSFSPGHHAPRGGGEHRAQRPPSHVPLYSVSPSSGTV